MNTHPQQMKRQSRIHKIVSVLPSIITTLTNIVIHARIFITPPIKLIFSLYNIIDPNRYLMRLRIATGLSFLIVRSIRAI